MLAASGSYNKPKATWPVIEGEPDDIAGLYKNYLVYLAGVSSLAAFIGFSLIGTGMMGIHFRVPILAGLANMVVGFVLTLVMGFEDIPVESPAPRAEPVQPVATSQAQAGL